MAHWLVKQEPEAYSWDNFVRDKRTAWTGVEKEHYPDPTADEGDWSAVDLVPVKPLAKPVTLDQIKSDKALKEMTLVRMSRLSVTAVTAEQFKRIMELAG